MLRCVGRSLPPATSEEVYFLLCSSTSRTTGSHIFLLARSKLPILHSPRNLEQSKPVSSVWSKLRSRISKTQSLDKSLSRRQSCNELSSTDQAQAHRTGATMNARMEDGFTSFSEEARVAMRQFLARSATTRKRQCSLDLMIVFALAWNTRRAWTIGEILWWISIHFPGERLEIVRMMDGKTISRSADVHNRLRSPALSIVRKQYSKPSRYTVTASEAFCMLAPVVLPRRKGHFDFMGLPVEIRCMIYDEILCYPRHVLQVNSRSKHRWYLIGTTDKVLTFPPPGDHKSRPIKDIQTSLAILSLNKQVFHEACPVFYSRNRFHAPLATDLGAFLRGIGPERRSYLTKLMFGYCHRPGKAFRLITECVSLTDIGIGGIYERYEPSPRRKTFTLVGRRDSRSYQSPSTVPTFLKLAKLRNVKRLFFERYCPRSEAYLRPLVTQLRKAPKRRSKSKAGVAR